MMIAEKINSALEGAVFSNLQHRDKSPTELWRAWSEVAPLNRVARTAIGVSLKPEVMSRLLINRVFGGLPADMGCLVGCGSNSIVYSPGNDNSNVVKTDKRSVYDNFDQAEEECGSQREDFSLLQEAMDDSVVNTDVAAVEFTNSRWGVGVKQPKLEGTAVFGSHGDLSADFYSSSYSRLKLVEFASKVRRFEESNDGLIVDIVGERNVLQTPADKVVLLDVGALPGTKYADMHMSGRSIYEEYVYRLGLLNNDGADTSRL